MHSRQWFPLSVLLLLLATGGAILALVRYGHHSAPIKFSTERVEVDMRFRGGWEERAVYRLRHDVYLMQTDGPKVLQPSIDVHPNRVVYSEEEKQRGLVLIPENVPAG